LGSRMDMRVDRQWRSMRMWLLIGIVGWFLTTRVQFWNEENGRVNALPIEMESHEDLIHGFNLSVDLSKIHGLKQEYHNTLGKSMKQGHSTDSKAAPHVQIPHVLNSTTPQSAAMHSPGVQKTFKRKSQKLKMSELLAQKPESFVAHPDEKKEVVMNAEEAPIVGNNGDSGEAGIDEERQRVSVEEEEKRLKEEAEEESRSCNCHTSTCTMYCSTYGVF